MNLSIAIPNSSLIDETNKVDKTRKISKIARACAIFNVREIYIYRDSTGNESDSVLLSTLLKYLETPQYFRKQMFPKMNVLKFAGVLQPLKLPHHSTISNPKLIKIGDIRDGLVLNYKGRKYVDVGIGKLIPYFGKKGSGIRIIIQITKISPKFSIKEISREQIKEYWGYKVSEGMKLYSLLSSWNDTIILTTKHGKIFTKSDAEEYKKLKKPILVVFGSPKKGIHEILGDIKKIQNCATINFFPNQATETVRLDEAILGTLSILNIFSINYT